MTLLNVLILSRHGMTLQLSYTAWVCMQWNRLFASENFTPQKFATIEDIFDENLNNLKNDRKWNPSCTCVSLTKYIDLLKFLLVSFNTYDFWRLLLRSSLFRRPLDWEGPGILGLALCQLLIGVGQLPEGLGSSRVQVPVRVHLKAVVFSSNYWE